MLDDLNPSPAKTAEPVIINVNSQGVIDVKEKANFKEHCDRLEFCDLWPFKNEEELVVSFSNFFKRAGNFFHSDLLTNFADFFENKKNELANSDLSNLLHGPCLPAVMEDSSSYDYTQKVSKAWLRLGLPAEHNFIGQRLEGRRITNQVVSSDQSEGFTPILIFPRAIPPMTETSLLKFNEKIEDHPSLRILGPLEVLNAFLLYPELFQGTFRIFFPGFVAENDLDAMPALLCNRRKIIFDPIKKIQPKDYDFCLLGF